MVGQLLLEVAQLLQLVALLEQVAGQLVRRETDPGQRLAAEPGILSGETPWARAAPGAGPGSALFLSPYRALALSFATSGF